MKIETVIRLLFMILIWMPFGPSFAQTGQSAIIQTILQQVAKEPWNVQSICADGARSLMAFDPSATATALYDALGSGRKALNQNPTVFELAHDLPNLDVDTWVNFAEKEEDSYLLGTLLNLVDYTGKGTYNRRFSELLVRLLDDKRMAQELHGEARAYGMGKRVCDVAYNILVARETSKPPEYPISAVLSPTQRDKMIADLVRRLKVKEPKGTSAQPKPTKDRDSERTANLPDIANSTNTWHKQRSWLWVCAAILMLIVVGTAYRAVAKRKRRY